MCGAVSVYAADTLSLLHIIRSQRSAALLRLEYATSGHLYMMYEDGVVRADADGATCTAAKGEGSAIVCYASDHLATISESRLTMHWSDGLTTTYTISVQSSIDTNVTSLYHSNIKIHYAHIRDVEERLYVTLLATPVNERTQLLFASLDKYKENETRLVMHRSTPIHYTSRSRVAFNRQYIAVASEVEVRVFSLNALYRSGTCECVASQSFASIGQIALAGDDKTVNSDNADESDIRIMSKLFVYECSSSGAAVHLVTF